jgi:uncharacterized damage-inducible protein DinB
MDYSKLKSGNNLNEERRNMILPKPDEYVEFYAGYMKMIPHDNIIQLLEEGRDSLQRIINSLPVEKGNYSYADGKWSIKELLGHLADAERVMSYRAMSIARGEVQSLPGFEQDDYVNAADFNKRSLSSFADELLNLRNANLALFKSFDEETLARRGKANNYEFTVRAFMFIIAGHELHHLKILKERYL